MVFPTYVSTSHPSLSFHNDIFVLYSASVFHKEPLNSGDDVSDEDPQELFDTENVVVCQYDKVREGDFHDSHYDT